MEFHQLVYFVHVAEMGSFSKAAERCGVAQSSLSQQIIKLEKELGQPLFERLHHHTVLTALGEQFLPRANHILNMLHDAKELAHSPQSEIQGTLAVGFIPTIAACVLPPVIQKFRQAFPQAQLQVEEDVTENLIDALVEGKLHVAITSLPIHNKHIHTRELLTEQLVLAASQNHNINEQHLHIKALEDYPFIALHDVHCLSKQIHVLCQHYNINTNIICQASQLSTVQKCVALGLGISLVPYALSLQNDIEGVRYHTLPPTFQRKIAASTHKKRKNSYLAEKFIAIVQEQYAL